MTYSYTQKQHFGLLSRRLDSNFKSLISIFIEPKRLKLTTEIWSAVFKFVCNTSYSHDFGDDDDCDSIAWHGMACTLAIAWDGWVVDGGRIPPSIDSALCICQGMKGWDLSATSHPSMSYASYGQ